MIGETMGGGMNKLSVETSNEVKNINQLAQSDYPWELSYAQIETFVKTDEKLNPYEEKILWFFDTDGKLKGKAMTIWTLTFTQASDGTVSLPSYDTTAPTDKFKIEYTVQTKLATEKITTIDALKYNDAASLSTEKLFSPDTKFTDVFTAKTEKALSLFDDYQQTLYRKFMESIVDPGLDAFISDDNYTTAFTKLEEILAKNMKYSELTDLKALIEKEDLSADEKTLIVDKFKTIFSYITYLTDGKADGTNLSVLINAFRWIEYKKLFWPDRTTTYPLITDYRKDIANNLKSASSLQRQTVENLIGFTAFYRLSGKWRGYSMTALGATNVLSNGNLDESMEKIDNADELPKAQEWFTNNLDVNKTNKKMILEKLNKQLESQKITLKSEDLNSLFKWEYISIGDWNKKVTLDVQYYFYLLGECGNESIWAQINSIKIYEKISGEYRETTVDGETAWITRKKRDVTIETQTKNSEYDIVATQKDLTISGAVSKKKKIETPPPPPPTQVDAIVPPPPPHTEPDPIPPPPPPPPTDPDSLNP